MDRLKLLLQFLEKDPDDEFTRFALAMEFVKSGDEARARQTLVDLVADRPDYVGAYYHLAALYIRVGLHEAAAETYRTGIRVAERQRDRHARSELQAALLELEGIGYDDD